MNNLQKLLTFILIPLLLVSLGTINVQATGAIEGNINTDRMVVFEGFYNPG